MKTLIVSIVAIYIATFLSAQDKTCDAALMEDLKQMSTEMKDATFLKDFNVHLEKATTAKPKPEESFKMVLSKNTVYRFALKPSSKYSENVVLSLAQPQEFPNRTEELKKITHNAEKQFSYFDYHIKETGMYTIKVFNENGTEACALAVIYYVRPEVCSEK